VHILKNHLYFNGYIVDFKLKRRVDVTAKTLVTVRGGRHRKALDQVLQGKVAKMEKICSSIKQCRIVVDALTKSQRPNRFDVKILCRLAGKNSEITAKSEGKEHLSLAVMDAFNALRGQLLQYATQVNPHQYRHIKARHDDKRDF